MQILTYPLRSKTNKRGQAPLMIRITVGPGDKAEINSGKTVDPKLWDVDKKRMTGKSVQADILNKHLTFVENKLNQIENKLIQDETAYSAEIVRNIYLGKHIARYGIMQVLKMHNAQFKEKLGQKDYSEGRHKKYVNLEKKLEYFMETTYKRKEMFMTEIQMGFIEDWFHFLTTKGKEGRGGKFVGAMAQSSACVTTTMLNKIAKLGFRRQGIAINPFEEFEYSYKCEGKEPLEMEEILEILNHDFKIKRLDRVRDRVIIGCFTGMADTDIQSCTTDMIKTNIDGTKWIDKGRDKSGELCLIPLWEPVLNIIEKYKDDPELQGTNRVFPQISLTKMNLYLQEIADACRITKHLTTHVFRYTFADIYLNAGGTLENLARILGHADIKTTKGYAKRNKTTIAREATRIQQVIFFNIDRINQDAEEMQLRTA